MQSQCTESLDLIGGELEIEDGEVFYRELFGSLGVVTSADRQDTTAVHNVALAHLRWLYAKYVAGRWREKMRGAFVFAAF